MGESWGVAAAVLSSGLGGTAVGATRYLAGAGGPAPDPLTLGALRFGIGFLVLLPIAWMRRADWPERRDWPGVAGLGLLFFGLFQILFNASLIFTTAARSALALSTLPRLTMVAGVALGAEPLTARKTLSVFTAMPGVALALLSGLTSAPAGAWFGDLLMIGGALCMVLYNVWSRPFIRRSGPLPFTTLRHGKRRAVPDPPVGGARRLDGGRRLRAGAMAGRRLSRRLWRRCDLLPVGLRPRAHQTDTGRRLGDDQSGHRVAGRRRSARRATALEPPGRTGHGGARHRHRDDGPTPARCGNRRRRQPTPPVRRMSTPPRRASPWRR
ncbi:hypothetical protein [Azospirillum doebereinerae]